MLKYRKASKRWLTHVSRTPQVPTCDEIVGAADLTRSQCPLVCKRSNDQGTGVIVRVRVGAEPRTPPRTRLAPRIVPKRFQNVKVVNGSRGNRAMGERVVPARRRERAGRYDRLFGG